MKKKFILLFKSYFTTSVTLTLYAGGDKLLVSSEIPTTNVGLSAYQIYLDGNTLKVNLS